MKRRKYTITDYDGNFSVTFDNKTYVTSLVDLGSIDANLSTYVGAGQNGETVTSRSYGTRDVTIEGHILADDADTMKSRKSILQKIIVPTADFWLIIDDKYKLQLTATATAQYSTDWYRNCEYLTSFTIEATAYNPFFQTLAPISANVAGWIKDFYFPYANESGDTFTFGHQKKTKSIDLYSESEVDTGMIIKIKAIGGTLVQPFIQNVDTGETFRCLLTLQSGDELTINTGYGEKSIIYNGTTNALGAMDFSTTWIQMPPGASSFKCDYSSSSTGTAECNIYYTPYLIEV